VYYANYLKYFERARTEWLRSLGFEQDVLGKRDGILFALHSVMVDYHQPAFFNDQLDVRATICEKRRASLVFNQSIERQGETGNTLCSGTIKIACLDVNSFRPVPIPDHVYREMPDVS
jgi:acyl-CoA thioester hydrolase